MNATLHAKEPELGKRGSFELLVGENLGASRMVHRVQRDLVEIGDLAQLLGDPEVVLTIDGSKRRSGDGYVLLVIHGEIAALAIACAQWRYTQDVGDEPD